MFIRDQSGLGIWTLWGQLWNWGRKRSILGSWFQRANFWPLLRLISLQFKVGRTNGTRKYFVIERLMNRSPILFFSDILSARRGFALLTLPLKRIVPTARAFEPFAYKRSFLLSWKLPHQTPWNYLNMINTLISQKNIYLSLRLFVIFL